MNEFPRPGDAGAPEGGSPQGRPISPESFTGAGGPPDPQMPGGPGGPGGGYPPPPGGPGGGYPPPGGPDEPERSNATNWLLAGILVALVAIIGVLFFGNRDDTTTAGDTVVTSTTVAGDSTTTEGSTTTTADETTTTGGETTTTVAETTTTSEPESTTTTVIEDPELAAANAALDWIAAIGAGDADAAWALVGDASRAEIGDRDGFDDIFTALQEGFGAWDDATDPNGSGAPWVFTNKINDELYVVTLAGTVSQEGTTSVSAAAIPVRVAGGGVKVQPFLRTDPVGFDGPGTVPAATRFEFDVAGEPTVRVFENAREFGVEVVGSSGGNTTVLTAPYPGEVGGYSAFTVVLLDDDVIHADAFLLLVAEEDPL